MADKDFKVKNRLYVNGLSHNSGVILATNNNLDSHSLLPTQYGGTGTTQSPSAGQILYSASGSTYTPSSTSVIFPTQSGNTGKYLTTDGSSVSWGIPNYSEVAVDGVLVNPRRILNLIGASIQDDPANNRTNVTIGSSQYSQVLLTEDITGMSIL